MKSSLTKQLCDRSLAERYLSILDPSAQEFTFQVFTDCKARRANGRDALAQMFHGSLDQYWSHLVDLNRLGAGIFVCINQTDLRGRKTVNIVRARAVWRDMDDPTVSIEPPLNPHITVQTSSGKAQDLFLVDKNVTIEDTKAFQQKLIKNFGSDPAAKGATRVLRLAGFFHLKNPENPHLVTITHESAAKPYTHEMLNKALDKPNGLSDRASRKPGVNNQAGEGKAPVTVQKNIAIGPTALLSEDEVEIYRSALQALAPDCDYETWIMAGQSLHSLIDPRMFDLWDTWSKRGAKYSPGETRTKWDSFSVDGGRTVDSLISAASKLGWFSEKKATIDREKSLRKFSEKHAFVMVNGKHAIVCRKYREDVKIWDSEFQKPTSCAARFDCDYVPKIKRKADGSIKVVQQKLYDAWWNSKKHRVNYDAAVFKPIAGLVAQGAKLPEPTEHRAYNLYQGLMTAPIEGDCAMLLDHIKNIWCNSNADHYEYVLNWLAAVFQRPDRPGETALILKSGEGTGKNTIVDIVTRAFGVHGIACTKPTDITGEFNDHLATAVFVFLNEAVWGGNREGAGSLRGWITDMDHTVNRKFLPKFKIRNCAHIVLSANDDWVAPIGLDDRRFFVLEPSEERVGDFEYFSEINKLIRSGGDTAFVHYLLNRDLSDFEAREMPETTSRLKLKNKILSSDTGTQWWYERLSDGHFSQETMFDGGMCSTTQKQYINWETGDIWVSTTDLHNDYLEWALKQRKTYPETKTSIIQTLRKLIGPEFKRKKETNVYRRREWGYAIPELTKSRAHFEEKAKQKIDWATDPKIT